MSKTYSWVCTAPGKMERQTFPIPGIGPEDLLMKIQMVTICGSDPHYLMNRMGNTKYPQILGHEMVGTVHAMGELAAKRYGVQKGDRITVEPYIPCGACEFCLSGHYQLCRQGTRCYGCTISAAEPPHLWGAYGEYMYVAPGSMVHKVADGIPDEDATFSSTIGNGFRFIVNKAQLNPNDSVLIIGPGALGLCTVIAARESGVGPIIVTGVGTKDEKRLALAEEYGADYTIRVDEEDAETCIREITGGDMVHAAIECSGAQPSYDLAFRAMRPLATLVVVGVIGKAGVLIDTDNVMRNEFQIKGSLGQPLDVHTAMKTINKGKYRIDKMVTHKFPISKADEAIRYFMAGHPDCIRVAICGED